VKDNIHQREVYKENKKANICHGENGINICYKHKYETQIVQIENFTYANKKLRLYK